MSSVIFSVPMIMLGPGQEIQRRKSHGFDSRRHGALRIYLEKPRMVAGPIATFEILDRRAADLEIDARDSRANVGTGLLCVGR